jgi:hypothetical protein
MDNSPFAKLPAELTNSIAELALYHEDGIFINDKKKKFRYASALAQTCKQMRKDYTEVFYELNTFSLNASNSPAIKKRICTFGNSVGRPNFAAAGLVTLVLTSPLEHFDYPLADLVWEISTGRRSRLIAGLVVKLLYKDDRCLSEFYISQQSPYKCLETARQNADKAVRDLALPNPNEFDFANAKRAIQSGLARTQRMLRVTRG